MSDVKFGEKDTEWKIIITISGKKYQARKIYNMLVNLCYNGVKVTITRPKKVKKECHTK